MKRNHARLILVLSVLLFTIVGFDLASLFSVKNKENQNISVPKRDLVQTVNDLGYVLAGGVYYYRFELYETGTDNFFVDAAATVVNTASFQGSNACTGLDGIALTNTFYISNYHNSFYEINCGTNVNMTVSVSRAGYQTKQFTLNPDNSTVAPSGILTQISIDKTTTSTNTTTNTTIKKPTTTSTKPPVKTAVKVETIKDVTLPTAFKGTGSSSTDLSKINDTAKVEGLRLDTDKSTIEFKAAVDLSSTDTRDKFKNLGIFVRANQTGVVSIDSTNLPALNKPATITMKSLPFVKTPRVLVNGKVDSSVVSNIKFSNGTLTFDVTHFSTFTAAPTVGIVEPADKLETKETPLTLRGTVSDRTASVSAKVNGRSLGKLQLATASGEFKKSVDLEQGVNKIVVSALSANGNTASATVSVTLLIAASNLMPYYLIVGLLAVIAALGFILAVRKIKHHTSPKPPTSGSSTTVASETKAQAPKSTGTPWENTPPPTIT